MERRIIQLYDDFTHCHLDLAVLLGSTAAALALLPLLESNDGLAQTIPESDTRLRTEEASYPGSNGAVAHTARLIDVTAAPLISCAARR
jgi:carboxymethylenebutenolidase